MSDQNLAKVVALLSDGAFHSGDELGEALGVTRAAVWKKVQKLQGLGLDIFSVRGKGYRMNCPIELLSADVLREYVDPVALPLLGDVDIRDSVGSTNDVALKRVAAGVGNGYACFAEQQTAGRGRRGRAWVSPFGRNIYLSVVWHFHQGAAALEGLSLATGMAVVDALLKLGCQGAQLKWPNDIMIDRQKLGGVLLEMTGDPSGHCQVVLGVGLNVSLNAQDGASIDQPYVALDDLGVVVPRNQVAGVMLGEILQMVDHFERHGFAPFRERWPQYDAYRDKQVAVHVGSQVHRGIARGVDATGGLRIEAITGVTVYKGGEISLREDW